MHHLQIRTDLSVVSEHISCIVHKKSMADISVVSEHISCIVYKKSMTDISVGMPMPRGSKKVFPATNRIYR